MKRYLCLICILLLLLPLWGCHSEEQPAAHFYYLRSQETIAYGKSDALIAPVEITAESSDLMTLFQLYLQGPDSEQFRSPLPANIRLLSVSRAGDMLVLEFTSGFMGMSEIQMSLAGACLCATAYEITGLEAIEIQAVDQKYEFRYDDFLLLDSTEPTE